MIALKSEQVADLRKYIFMNKFETKSSEYSMRICGNWKLQYIMFNNSAIYKVISDFCVKGINIDTWDNSVFLTAGSHPCFNGLSINTEFPITPAVWTLTDIRELIFQILCDILIFRYHSSKWKWSYRFKDSNTVFLSCI